MEDKYLRAFELLQRLRENHYIITKALQDEIDEVAIRDWERYARDKYDPSELQ
jgi:hypothetical protein